MPQETFSLSSFTKTSADLKRNATFTAYASGGGFPAFAVADSVTLYLSSIKTYSSSGRLSVSLGGASGSCSLPQNSSVHSATLSLSLDGGNWASLSDGTATFTVLGGASTSTNIINLRSGITGSLTVNYHINMTECKPPTSVTLDATLVNAGTSTTLRWSGASAGTNNPIGAYVIYRSSNGGSSYSELATVGATVSSYTVTAPSTMGASYVYKVAVVSGMEGVVTMSTATATLTAKTYTACSAPTTVTISASSVAPGASVTLSWSGAKAGTNNAISGYHVYRATSAGGTYAHITSVTTTAASGSTAVTAPTSNGSSYYYKVYTLGAAGYNSGASSVYATLICSYSAPSAPPSVSIGGGASAYALSGATVTLAWSGAGAGTNNPITGYDIYQNGTIYVQGLSAGTTSHAVAAHTAAGSSYTYTVVTRGAYSNSGASAGRVVYTYSHPIAPTAVSVSNSTPDAGTSVTLSWSGAEAGSYNVIARYKVYRADTPSGEYTELTSVDSTATSGSCSVTAPGTMGSSFYYKVVTVGVRSVSGQSSAYAAVTAQTYSACTAPSTVTLSKTSDAIPGETVTLSWSGAAAGMHNPISGYQVYCQLDGQAAVLLDTLSASVSSLPVTASNTLGGSAAYYLITVGTKAGFSSAASRTATVTTLSYTACTAPSSISLSATIAETNLTLSWNGAAAGASNPIRGYRVSCQDSIDNVSWGSLTELTILITSAASGSVSVFPSATRGAYRRFAVQTLGTATGFDSGYTYSASVRKNRLPPTPSFRTGTVTYLTSPMVLLQAGTEPDGQTQTLWLSVDGGAYQETGTQTRLQGLTIGGHVIRAYSVDALGAVSEIAQQALEVIDDGYTDNNLKPKETIVKAAHINELRRFIDLLRAYYLLTPHTWSEPPVAGSTSLRLWKEHVTELRSVVDETYTLLGLQSPTWLDLPVNCPKAATIEELRAALLI